MFAVNPGVLAAGSSVQDDLAKFLAWASQFRDDTSFDTNTRNISATLETKSRITMPAGLGGSMGGSPWGTYYSSDSKITRVAQHLFEDVPALNANLGKVVVIYGGSSIGPAAPFSVTRNGYSSQTHPETLCLMYASLSYLDPRHPGKRVEITGFSRNKTLHDL